jgi:hypothetical protein
MTLVGYPVDGIPAANQGQIFATQPANIDFSLETAAVDGTTGVPYRLYTTKDITAAGGVSGAPLFVQLNGASFYPAAIYLGGDGETVVRAIDSNVVTLFTSAETSGNGGANHIGGGVTQANAPGSAATFTNGGMSVTLGPAGAVAEGAGWSLDGGATYQASGATLSNLTPGAYQVSFAPVADYAPPAPQQVPVESGKIATFQATYARLVPAITSATRATAIEGQPFNYQIDTLPVATSYLTTSTLPSGLALDSTTGLISGTVPVGAATGLIPISLKATNAQGTGNPFTLSLNVALPGQLTVTISGNGTVPAIFSGTTIQAINAPISIKATPAPGNLFANWTDADNGTVLSSSELYTFPMPGALDLQANFIVNPFLTGVGAYLALLQGDGYTDSGFAKVTVEPGRVFDALFHLGGASASIRGAFGNLGQYQGAFTLSDRRVISATLSLGTLLTGTLASQTDQIPFTAERTAPHDDSSLAGTYTALLPALSGTAFPAGNGYGSLTVSKTGIVKFAGKLGDALPFTFSGSLDSTGALPFLISKPATKTTGAELLLGAVAFPPAASGTAGTLNWYRTANPKDPAYPSGFSVTLPILTSTYASPAVDYHTAIVTFSGAGITPSLTEPINIVNPNHVITTGATPFTLKFISATGQFTGLFPDSGKARPFTGSVLQSGTTALGLFQDPTTGQTGSVQLQPTE